MSSPTMFIILTSLLGPSIVCTLFLFYQFLQLPPLRHKPRNYLVICLLIMNFIQEIIELPPRLYFLYNGTVIFPNTHFCDFWNWCQYTLVSINLLIMALTSIDRYLLIFNHIFLSQHTILLRQIPLLLCILFPSIFYIIGIYGIPCKNIYNYNTIGCGLPCFFSLSSFAVIFKNIIMICLPVMLTIAMSCVLITRVYIQRKSMKRRRNFWKESIQMIIQLLPILILYLSIWIPLSILFYFSTFGTKKEKNIVMPLINDYFGNLKYLVNLIYPFLVLFGQIELRTKIKTILSNCCRYRRRARAAVVPLTNTIERHIHP
ncbi:unnamed protein product [Adineta steineri]|uniref:G-protein coupled receptors family 1 profile domain-containing protein n=1 Tax=Adineta steineri TaxID=433720 RepID=A0A813TQP8_9BILA|nr:unnamed protein product [Adineta steineri]CAF1399272.1 unnamed protein product [Adineta steineri]